MTNIATLFNVYPDTSRLLKGLYVMNGYFGTEPLHDPYYNWNSWASKIVFFTPIAIPLSSTIGSFSRAKSMGNVGESWLANLDHVI